MLRDYKHWGINAYDLRCLASKWSHDRTCLISELPQNKFQNVQPVTCRLKNPGSCFPCHIGPSWYDQPTPGKEWTSYPGWASKEGNKIQ